MTCPVSALDVAAYILQRTGTVTAMKLQKLVYYAQAWSLVREEKLLFPERIEAWANGPVCPTLYASHRGEFEVSTIATGDASKLTGDAKTTVDVVIEAYGKFAGYELSEMTHREAPWVDARAGLAAGERGTAEIPSAAMAEYYGSLR